MLSVGVMLGGGLLHLLPEAVEGAKGEGFPFPYLAFSLGLLLPLCIEQLLHAQQHCQSARLGSAPARRLCLVSGRAWRLWTAHHSQEEACPHWAPSHCLGCSS